jgi:formate C-acetyltransferase
MRAIRRGRDEEEGAKRLAYRSELKLCLERARLLTEVFKQTEGEPMIIRKAKALAHILQNMTIYIDEGQLIAGNYASTPESLPCYPEMAIGWLQKAVNDGYRTLLDDAGREEMAEITAYWRGKQAHGKERAYLPEDLKPWWAYNGVTFVWRGAESGVPNYEKLFRVGLNGVIKEAEDKLNSLSDTMLPPKDYVEARDFLEAAIISLRAAIDFGKRFAELAKAMAADERDVQRKEELGKIAQICEGAPGNPPRSFYEALQFFYFIHLITHLIELYMNGAGVRIDQILYPFYKKDREEGNITREEALELLECLFLKLDEQAQLMPPITVAGAGAVHGWCTLTIGGIDRQGEDASNEISYLVLDAVDELRTLLQPSIAFRYHEKVPHALVLRVIDVLHTGIGYPALFNDKYEIPMLVQLGMPLEDARDYAIEACMRWNIPGKNIACRALNGMVVLPKCLELALNQGWDKFSGKQLGPRTPDPLTFTSIDDVIDAYLEQVSFAMDKLARINNLIDVFYEQDLSRPFLSALMDGCIEKGKDCRRWSYFYKTIVGPMGTTTLADALAAMKKLVFEEKRVSMAELLDALRNNWEGKEELRQMFLNEAPKFGNDDDYVDTIALDVLQRTNQIVESFTNFLNFPFIMDGSSGAAYWGYSDLLGATPDGRKEKEPFNDGTISPVTGRDKKGPTAVLKSVSKVNPRKTFNQLLNQKFLPRFLEGENKEVFADYLKTWADLGIHHIQFNVVSAETLREAQGNPEKYRDLVVRVAGFSAYFVDLPRGLQDAIVARVEQTFA